MDVTISAIKKAVLEVILLRKDYASKHTGSREMLLDPMLYSFLQGRFDYMARQYRVGRYQSGWPKRIDFWHGTSNPTAIEFAVRPPKGGGTLYGTQNKAELCKLCRVSKTKARKRILLLVDLFKSPMDEKDLRASYASFNAGRGRFTRQSVRVIYVHAERQFHFLWYP